VTGDYWVDSPPRPGPPLGRCEDIDCGENVYEGEECADCYTQADLLQHNACCDRAFILPDGEDPEHPQ